MRKLRTIQRDQMTSIELTRCKSIYSKTNFGTSTLQPNHLIHKQLHSTKSYRKCRLKAQQDCTTNTTKCTPIHSHYIRTVNHLRVYKASINPNSKPWIE